MNKHNERAELIDSLRRMATIACPSEGEILSKAAAMLEAQPAEQVAALKKRDLTGLGPDNGASTYFRGLGWNEAIDAMALQPAEQAKGQDSLFSALAEARRWIGDGDMSDGLHRDYWTPEYAAIVDRVDSALNQNLAVTPPAQPAEQAKGREAAALMDECLVAIHAAACTLGNFGSYFFGCSRQVGLRQDQVEQYQEMHRKAEEGVNALMDLHDQLRGLQPDHTTPPAQPAREWVGLTHEEQTAIAKRNTVSTPCPEGCEYTCGESVAMDTEAKLREKNAGLPAAVPDDIPAILKKQAS